MTSFRHEPTVLVKHQWRLPSVTPPESHPPIHTPSYFMESSLTCFWLLHRQSHHTHFWRMSQSRFEGTLKRLFPIAGERRKSGTWQKATSWWVGCHRVRAAGTRRRLESGSQEKAEMFWSVGGGVGVRLASAGSPPMSNPISCLASSPCPPLWHFLSSCYFLLCFPNHRWINKTHRQWATETFPF